jgi:hypothetical protein
MEILKKILDSKKFWYAVGTLFILFFSDSIGINDQEINNVVLIALALIISQGLADRCKENGCKK